MKPYWFPPTRPGKLYTPPGGLFDQEKDQEEVIGLIQGRTPGSKEEWYVATALWRLKHSFIYQYEMFGGNIRGGQIVDFLVVTTVPQSTFIQVYGEYWHNGEMGSEDQFKLAQLENEGLEVVVLWGRDLPDKEEAYTILRSRIGPA